MSQLFERCLYQISEEGNAWEQCGLDRDHAGDHTQAIPGDALWDRARRMASLFRQGLQPTSAAVHPVGEVETWMRGEYWNGAAKGAT